MRRDRARAPVCLPARDNRPTKYPAMKNSLKTLVAAVPAVALVACVIHTKPSDSGPPPPPPPATATATDPAPTATAADPVTTTTTTTVAPVAPVVGAKAAGKPCETGADCASGACEGGCGDGEGRCTSKLRRCIQTEMEFCGCDGVTFKGSSTCPGQRYQYQGPCEAKTQ